MDRGHVPIRTCVVCGCRRSKFALLRMALDSERLITLDRRQVSEGRGAYLCPECLPRLSLNRRLQKAFRQQARGLAQDISASISQTARRGETVHFGETGAK